MHEFLSTVGDICLFIVIFGGPISLLLFFIVSLVRFIRAPKNDPALRKERKFSFILSASLIVIFCIALAFLILSTTMADITYM